MFEDPQPNIPGAELEGSRKMCLFVVFRITDTRESAALWFGQKSVPNSERQIPSERGFSF
jgi:hypothetical protein